jgi:BioD-like phosphotransacetylase family protein
MMKVFIAATRQNDGKTTVALGLIANFLKRYSSVGYCKPVGHEYRTIDGQRIDKDAVLMQTAFDLPGNLKDMSPIIVYSGFTREYIHGQLQKEDLDEMLLTSFRKIEEQNDIVLIEGTGHAGVGSVFDMSNAHVAHMLNSKVILVTRAGIGRPIDEIMLNRALFENNDVGILGVIINKVDGHHLEKIRVEAGAGLERLGIPLLGVIPFARELSSPTFGQVMEEFSSASILSGEEHLDNRISDFLIGTMSPSEAMNYLKDKEEVLLIVPGTREDMIMMALSLVQISGSQLISGILVTKGVEPHPNILMFVRQLDIPMVLVDELSFRSATIINNLLVKIRPNDIDKINRASQMVESYIDVQQVVDRLSG